MYTIATDPNTYSALREVSISEFNVPIEYVQKIATQIIHNEPHLVVSDDNINNLTDQLMFGDTLYARCFHPEDRKSCHIMNSLRWVSSQQGHAFWRKLHAGFIPNIPPLVTLEVEV